MFMDKVVDLFLNDSSTRKKWELVVLVAMFWSISVLKTIMLEQGSHQFDELPTQEKTFHSFIFTKAKYAASFEHLHFNLLAKTDEAAFLENGTPDIQDYLHDLPKIDDQANKKIAAIVMNANPFTLGHKHWLPVQ